MTDGHAPERVDLRLLGGVEISLGPSTATGEGPAEGSGVVAQPKRLALLVYLALGRPGAVYQREKLLALLWPELPADRARAALSQAIYTLRRALGPELFVRRGADEVGLASGLVTTDVEAFEAALASGRIAEALESYRGDLLDGFFVSGATEFEDWLERERTRLRERAREAAWSLSSTAAAAGTTGEAARWARRAHAFAPTDETGLCRLMDTLEATGDVAGALGAYETYARWLEREYEEAPGAETQRRMGALRARRAELPVAAPPAVLLPTAAAEPVPVHAARRPVRARVTIAAAAASIVVVLFLGWTAFGRGDADNERVAVLPFDVQGDARSAYLAEGMVNLLGANLDGAGRLRIVDQRAVLAFARRNEDPDGRDVAWGASVARHFGAQRFVLGAVMDVGGSLRATAAIYTVRGERLAQADAVADTEADVFAMVDDLARGLLRGVSRTPGERFERLGIEATRSLPALKEYLAGEAQFRAAHYQEAYDAYTRAVALDSTFAIAHYRRAIAADWADVRDEVLRSLDAAVRHSAKLDDHERRLMYATDNYWRGSAVAAETTFVGLLRIWPDDVDAWFQYGELLFHQGPILGRPSVAAGAAFRRVLELQPDHESARNHLARVAIVEGRFALADSLMRASESSNAPISPEIALMRALATRDTARFGALVAALDREHEYAIWVAGWRTATYTRNLGAAIEILRAATRPGRPDEYRAVAHLSIAHLEAGRGRWRAAREAVARARPLDPVGAAYVEAYLETLPFAPPLDSTTARRLLDGLPAPLLAATLDPRRDQMLTTVPYDLAAPLAVQGLLAAQLGDAAGARGRLRALEQLRGEGQRFSPVGPRSALRGTLALRAGDEATLAAAADSLVTATKGLAAARRLPAYSYALDNFILAELLRALGQDDRALERYAALGDEFAYEAAFYAPSHLRRGELLERMGRPREAREEFARFVALWAEADEELREVVETARRKAGVPPARR